jgi:hypothetical protein
VELDEPQLYERPDIVETLYAVEPDEGQKLVAGAMLYVQPSSSDLLIAVDGHRRVGVVRGEGAAALIALLSANGQARVVMVQVISVQEISGVGHAQLVKQSI